MNKFNTLIKIFSLCLVSVFQMGAVADSFSPDTGANENELKAAFIYRFTDYIDWKNNSESATFNIAILEESPITAPLFAIAKEKKVKSKKINVKECKNLDEIGFCNILFVPANCSVPIETILSEFASKPVLIVTEKEGYAKKGAHLNFIIVETKLKFEINTKAINKSGIVISSFLLQHAIIIE